MQKPRRAKYIAATSADRREIRELEKLLRDLESLNDPVERMQRLGKTVNAKAWRQIQENFIACTRIWTEPKRNAEASSLAMLIGGLLLAGAARVELNHSLANTPELRPLLPQLYELASEIATVHLHDLEDRMREAHPDIPT